MCRSWAKENVRKMVWERLDRCGQLRGVVEKVRLRTVNQL